ncbi:glutamate synthase (NADPH/NADH) small chain [Negativicoccus succinicivorans]|uniref:Glutamate synthase (NADPH/NADH) small chain n=1 Tax=Negativicoccus succinicivorans TaxID=620903 RepID=A0A841R3R2_9FIRM|nr:FAD-dependent oxidoreductase [Negativicoccus succinicivorans]MBB6477797.1 glutamate synthase (NADPH/NADH) small chain [Negativicoccus succinicivorans]
MKPTVFPLATDRVRVTMEDLAQAIVEAQRCLHCPRPTCRTGCPIGNEIPQFIAELAVGNIGAAIRIINERSNLPSVCGRVCPHENQCQGHCILNRRHQPVKIGLIESVIGDVANAMMLNTPRRLPRKKEKVAVIGSGPAGLTVANDLRQLGYNIDVYDSAAEPGGVLLHGIPSFRINKAVVRFETERLAAMGVKFLCGQTFGKDFTLADLEADGYQAVFLGVGTTQPRDLPLQNDDLPGVLQAMDVLHAAQALADHQLTKEEFVIQREDRVVVIGAGNVAMDAARTALRAGARKVTVAYRRTQEFMACLPSEYEAAAAEGVEFRFLAAPVGVSGHEKVGAFIYEEQAINDLGELHGTGKREEIIADKVIIAVGHVPSTLLRASLPDLENDQAGYIRVRKEPYYGATNLPGVFAAGDIVHRPATVVLAMREAKKTAQGMAAYMDKLAAAAKEAAEGQKEAAKNPDTPAK